METLGISQSQDIGDMSTSLCRYVPSNATKRNLNDDQDSASR